MQQEQWRRVNRTRACASRHASDWSGGDGVRHRDGGKNRGTGRRRLRANNLARGPVDGVAVLVVVVGNGQTCPTSVRVSVANTVTTSP